MQGPITTEIWGIPMELTGEYQFGSMMGGKEEERRSTSSLVVENATEVVSVGKDIRLVR